MRRDRQDLQESTDPLLLNLLGMVRRMAISLTAKALWQLAGFRQADGTTETRTAEPFTGIGIYARPPISGTPEAIAVAVGSAKTLVIVGVRDQKTRAAVAGAIAEDETMLHNSVAVVYLKADGSIEARAASGTARGLAFNDDLKLLIDTIKGAASGNAIPGAVAAAFAVDPAGTNVLKGE